MVRFLQVFQTTGFSHRNLSAPRFYDILCAVQLPDLQALKDGDEAEWDIAFDWLWPTAFGAAQYKLQPYLPADAEDVAIEALEELVGKVRELKSSEELRPLVASIAHHCAVDRLRRHFAGKRGGGQTESLDAKQQDNGDTLDMAARDASPLDLLKHKELAAILRRLLVELKPPQGEIVADFFLHELSYTEIATKHHLAVGSVGVYLKRGLEAMRRVWGQRQNS